MRKFLIRWWYTADYPRLRTEHAIVLWNALTHFTVPGFRVCSENLYSDLEVWSPGTESVSYEEIEAAVNEALDPVTIEMDRAFYEK